MGELSIVFELLKEEIKKYEAMEGCPNTKRVSIKALDKFAAVLEKHESAKAERVFNILKAREYGDSKINYL